MRQVKSLGEAVEQSIMQNYAIDIYQASAQPGAGQGGCLWLRLWRSGWVRVGAEDVPPGGWVQEADGRRTSSGCGVMWRLSLLPDHNRTPAL